MDAIIQLGLMGNASIVQLGFLGLTESFLLQVEKSLYL